jgi:hypothetical protein
VLDAPDPAPRSRVARIDAAAGGLAVDLALYGLSALFAVVTALTSPLPTHRLWGSIAWIGYALATLVVIGQLAARRTGLREVLVVITWIATALAPLIAEAAAGRAQEEVITIEHGGERLLHTGTPYLSHDAIAALPADERLLGYLPYQPGMALFGLPRAVFGTAWWTDARVWFATVTALALALAIRQLPRSPRTVRALQVATVFPICALTLAVGGDDLPVLALCLLALAYVARNRPGAAGIAVGLAGALKLFAWPVAIVLLFLPMNRRRYAAGAFGIPALALVPAFLVDPDAAVENVVRFTLGRGLVHSTAATNFPGHLVALASPIAATALLAAAAVALAVWLLRRPPRDAAQAALICAVGLLTAILLMPATRFGYLLYPASYAVWATALPRVRTRSATPSAPARTGR